METKSSNAATTDFQTILTKELAEVIKMSVIFCINAKNTSVSPVEKEIISEDAWFHVLEKRDKYDSTKGTFRTWATKVARNYALSELSKLKNNPLHHTSSISEDNPDDKDESKEKKFSCRNDVHAEVEDGSVRLHWQYALEFLKSVILTFRGRDREIAEMLLNERTKEEMMTATQMSGGNVDACVCRVRKKMREALGKAGYIA